MSLVSTFDYSVLAGFFTGKSDIEVRFTNHSTANTNCRDLINIPAFEQHNPVARRFADLLHMHECGHIMFTDTGTHNDRNVQKLSEFLEDPRVDSLFTQWYPETLPEFDWGQQHIIDNDNWFDASAPMPKLKLIMVHAINFAYAYVTKLPVMETQAQTSHVAFDNQFGKEVTEKVEALILTLKDTKESCDVFPIAQSILDECLSREEQSQSQSVNLTDRHELLIMLTKNPEQTDCQPSEGATDNSEPTPLQFVEHGWLPEQSEAEVNWDKAIQTGMRLRGKLRQLITGLTSGGVEYKQKGKRVCRKRMRRLVQGDSRIFKHKQTVKGVDTSIYVLLDASGSMSCGDRMGVSKQVLIALLTAMSNAQGVKLGAAAFQHSKVEPLLKLGGRVTDMREPLHQLDAKGGTPLFEALQFTDREFERVGSHKNILIVITDGATSSKAAAKLKQMEFKGVSNYGIGIQLTSAIDEYYKSGAAQITDIQELYSAATSLFKSVVKQIYEAS